MANGLDVHVVLVTDGAPWTRDRSVPLFPKTLVVLDAHGSVRRISARFANREGSA
jgi:hypothetical protein